MAVSSVPREGEEPAAAKAPSTRKKKPAKRKARSRGEDVQPSQEPPLPEDDDEAPDRKKKCAPENGDSWVRNSVLSLSLVDVLNDLVQSGELTDCEAINILFRFDKVRVSSLARESN